MKRYLFTRELFRSRTLALAHVAFCASIAFNVPRGSLIVPTVATLFLALWLVVLAYNIYARWKEFRFTMGAAQKLLQAQREALLDPTEESAQGRYGHCFDCSSEGLKVEAQAVVAAGPNGEKKPVCMMHAYEQAQKNAEANL